ncbi:MAG: glycosyltransferase family A protein [Candidatus Acidiferrales bacterium]
MFGNSVSVVIPTYNYGRYVTEAVESALAQTLPPMEIIVVDDGSTDDTAARLRPYMGRISYIHQENKGLPAARNTGIRNATGEWIALLDSDDVWHRQKLEMQLRAVEARTDVALVGSPSAPTLDGPLPVPKVYELTVRDLLCSGMVGPSSMLIRRSSFFDVGYFDETLRSVEDRDMCLRLAARFRCVLVDSECWWYREHPGQMIRNANRMFTNYRRVLEKFFAEHPEHRELYRQAMAYLYFDAVWPYIEEHKPLTALRCLAASFYYRPLGLGDERKSKFIRLKVAVRVLFPFLLRLRARLRRGRGL